MEEKYKFNITPEELDKFMAMFDLVNNAKLDVRVALVNDLAQYPEVKTFGSAGADLRAAIPDEVTIIPGETTLIPLGIKTQFSPNHVALVFARSGLATREGLAPANKVAVIDSDYRGEWKLPIFNQSNLPRTIKPGDRIGQVIFMPIQHPIFIQCTEGDLNETERGEGGFGSTGVN